MSLCGSKRYRMSADAVASSQSPSHPSRATDVYKYKTRVPPRQTSLLTITSLREFSNKFEFKAMALTHLILLPISWYIHPSSIDFRSLRLWCLLASLARSRSPACMQSLVRLGNHQRPEPQPIHAPTSRIRRLPLPSVVSLVSTTYDVAH